jgi:hypothetical protein
MPYRFERENLSESDKQSAVDFHVDYCAHLRALKEMRLNPHAEFETILEIERKIVRSVFEMADHQVWIPIHHDSLKPANAEF